ncbi:MAG: hypothetical protein NUV67_05560 [archaeon]|nr:hypothetical protein [archaeon]
MVGKSELVRANRQLNWEQVRKKYELDYIGQHLYVDLFIARPRNLLKFFLAKAMHEGKLSPDEGRHIFVKADQFFSEHARMPSVLELLKYVPPDKAEWFLNSVKGKALMKDSDAFRASIHWIDDLLHKRNYQLIDEKEFHLQFCH